MPWGVHGAKGAAIPVIWVRRGEEGCWGSRGGTSEFSCRTLTPWFCCQTLPHIVPLTRLSSRCPRGLVSGAQGSCLWRGRGGETELHPDMHLPRDLFLLHPSSHPGPSRAQADPLLRHYPAKPSGRPVEDRERSSLVWPWRLSGLPCHGRSWRLW